MKIRTRLALSLAFCLLIAGVVVLLVNEAAIENGIYNDYRDFQQEFLSEIGVDRQTVEDYVREHPEVLTDFNGDAPVLRGGRSVNDIFREVQLRAQQGEIQRSRTYTALAIGVTAVVAGLAGWLIARRVLRPARLISERAHAASAADLGQRVALEGPNDEMKDLSNTFDDMLERLERSFEAQRRFAAQASHELRTPLSLIRAETDLLALDQHADPAVLQAVERIREAETRAEHLVSTLLALSRAESGNVKAAEFSLDELVGDVLADTVQHDRWSRVRVDLELDDAHVVADRQIVECVVENLLDNAERHNAGDWVRVEVATIPGVDRPSALVCVTNPTVASDVATMRAVLADDTETPYGAARGNGIGLTVVDLIAGALGGSVDVESIGDAVAVTVTIPAARAETSTELSSV